MYQRMLRFTTVAALLILVCGAWPADARYRYGSYRSASAEQGFYVFAEAALTNPRNTDSVIATSEIIQDFAGGINSLSPVLPAWDDELAGRVGVGYRFGGGSKLVASVWSYETDQLVAANGPAGGALHFAVGPPIFTGGSYVGNQGSPGYAEITTTVKAQTADVAFAREAEIGDAFTMEWTAGVRYVNFEETYEGDYDDVSSSDPDFGLVRYSATKSNEGDMVGVRVGVRGSYRFAERFSVSSGLGFSLLDGELTASSLLSPIGLNNASLEPSGFASLKDDGRSGSILDLEIVAAWHAANDSVQIWIGWEQSTWNEITLDLLRNFPGTTAPLRERDSVTFSGYKIGASVRF